MKNTTNTHAEQMLLLLCRLSRLD